MPDTTITDIAAYRVWELEHQLAEDLLRRVENVERALLMSLNCPTEPVDIYAILNREQPEPWPRRTSARDRTRALQAMHVLLQIAEVRRSIALGHENARLAAHAALLAGLYANSGAIEAALGRKVRQKNQRNAKRRRQEKSEVVARSEANVRREADRYRRQYKHPTYSTRKMAETIADKLDINADTVRGVLRRLRLK